MYSYVAVESNTLSIFFLAIKNGQAFIYQKKLGQVTENSVKHIFQFLKQFSIKNFRKLPRKLGLQLHCISVNIFGFGHYFLSFYKINIIFFQNSEISSKMVSQSLKSTIGMPWQELKSDNR